MTGDGSLRLDRLAGLEVGAMVEPIFREYGNWVAQRLLADHGLRFGEPDLDRHHNAFHAELPKLVGPRGRLLLAWMGDDPVGVGALKPVDAATAEVKRMYVRPRARGAGVGRALLERLLADARTEGYTIARLETLQFMTEAHALYRSLGFVDAAMFDGSEAVAAGLEALTYYMELKL